MVINVSVQCNDGLLPDIIILTLFGYIGEPFLYHVEQETTYRAVQREILGMYSSRVCVENRFVSTPARKGHVEPRALDGARSYFSLNSNHQRATNTHVYDRFPLIRMRPMNKSDDLFEVEGNVRAARPPKHTKFKTNGATTAAR